MIRFKIVIVMCVLFFMYPLAGIAVQDGGYNAGEGFWIKAVLKTPSKAVTLVWQEVGKDTSLSGDKVISGYFYADPYDFQYGSQSNPEVFVKIYKRFLDGWTNIAFNHVTVDNVDVYSANSYNGYADQSSVISLSKRLAEHSYDDPTPTSTCSRSEYDIDCVSILKGYWYFSTDIEDFIFSFDNIDTFSDGTYYISGIDDYGDIVMAGYSDSLNKWSILQLNPTLPYDNFYSFETDGATITPDCYYQVDHDTSDLSSCSQFSAYRLSSRKSIKKMTPKRSVQMVSQTSEDTDKEAIIRQYYILKQD